MPNNEEGQNPATAPEPENYGLPANFVPIDVPPIIPSNGPAGAVNPFGGGSLPQNLSLQPDFVNTLYRGGAVPTVRLMPVQGAPSTNAQSQSVAEKVVTEVIKSTTNGSGEFVSLETNGVINAEQDVLNLQNGTNTTAVYAGAGAVQINVPDMVGDSGSGGTSGAVPTPPAGSAAAGDFLKADGTWAVPPGATPFYQTVQQAGTSKPQESKLNFLAPITVTDDPGNTSSDVAVSVMVGDSGSGGVKGLVPAPPAGSGSTDYLRADGSWDSPPGTGGVAVVAIDLTGQNANISATTIATPGANGYYRISGWTVASSASPSGAGLPGISIKFTDADSSVVQTATLTYSNPAVNTQGVFGVINSSVSPGLAVWSGTFYAKSGVAIQYQTTGYAAGSGTALLYALHLRLEGPF
jgi:hypothetical protein